LKGYVSDWANVLTVSQETQLTTKLEALERSTGHQMVVVTVAGLDGMEISAFTTKLANSWDVGRKHYNDGVVLLIAPSERKARISVGYGLEKVLPDAFCAQILANEIIPPFRRGDLASGLNAGVVALIRKLQ
jgi:uncharacterized protein